MPGCVPHFTDVRLGSWWLWSAGTGNSASACHYASYCTDPSTNSCANAHTSAKFSSVTSTRSQPGNNSSHYSGTCVNTSIGTRSSTSADPYHSLVKAC